MYTSQTSQKMSYSAQWVELLVPVELRRDGTQSAWGFRLRGGTDVEGGTPLEIIRVFVGGASEGLLQVGDRILSINNSNAQSITHFEAQHLFKNSGTSVRLEVGRLVRCVGSQSPLQSGAPIQRKPDEISPVPVTSTPSYLHLPSPRDATFSKPQESETFKVAGKSPTKGFTLLCLFVFYLDYHERGD